MNLNCWEFNGCGREPGGFNDHTLGICPASIELRLQGVHGGVNAGRCCWIVAGTFSPGAPYGLFAREVDGCSECDFFKKVKGEEENNFIDPEKLYPMLYERSSKATLV